MDWFQNEAPIRLKMTVAFGALFAVMWVLVAIAFLAPTMVAVPLVAVILAGTGVQCLRFRAAVADPYVSTVLRMEGLADGDLEGPIERTDYKDCVGRMSRAMLTFRDNAAEQRRLAREQGIVVEIVSAHLKRVAEGDLTASIDEKLPSDFAALQTHYNDALASLRTLIGSVVEAAEAIRTGSAEIAQASEDLSRRTESNAASLEETAASVTQMDTRLKATATAATQTLERADGAIETVRGGRDVAEGAVQAMSRVSESAKGIDDVIEGLDKIAFQTRVLAMNAAVEAGRAGEAGRGFAVVADLVSALAMRAEEEAGRAREQLSATQADVGSAVEMVQKVDGALENIASGVGEVHTLLGAMAADNQAQSAAITEITTAINAMDQSTQQNAAMVEEASAAARNLTGEAESLNRQAAQFRTGHERRPAAAAPVRSRTAGVTALPVAAMRSEPANAEWAQF